MLKVYKVIKYIYIIYMKNLYNLYVAIIIAIILTILETIAQGALRKHYLQKKKNWLYLLISFSIYASIPIFLYISYSYVPTAIIEVFWDAGTTILVPITAYILFAENLSKVGWYGILITVIGTIMVGSSLR